MIYINIGSNLNSSKGDRIYNLKKSIQLLNGKKLKIIKISKIYETPSYPNEKNPKFLNICLGIESKQKAELLIKTFIAIEKKLQRNRSFKNQPRTCDIDIIDYYGKIINTNKITTPHPRAHLRNFVLFPILTIDAEWVHPIIKKNVKFLINKRAHKSRIDITRLNKNVIIKP